jgi:hypothetical protein
MLTCKYRHNAILSLNMTGTPSSLHHVLSDKASFSWFSTAELCSYVFYVRVPNIWHGFRCHNHYTSMFITINAPFVHHFRSQSQFHKHLLHTDRYTCVNFFLFLNTMLSKNCIQNLVKLTCWRRNPTGRTEGKVAVRKIRYNAKSLLRNGTVLLEQSLQGPKSICRESSGGFIHKCVHRMF